MTFIADHSPGPPSGAVDEVSTVRGGEDLGPESTVPAPKEGQKNLSNRMMGRVKPSQLMSEIMASLPLMAPWRLKVSVASAPKPNPRHGSR